MKMVRHTQLLLFILALTKCAFTVKVQKQSAALYMQNGPNRKKENWEKIHFLWNCNKRGKNRIIEKKKSIGKKKEEKEKKTFMRSYGRDHRNPHLAYEYINKILENKKYEVSKLLEENFEENNPLQIRLKYLQHTMNNKLSDNLKRTHHDEKHRLSIVADIKRKVFCNVTRNKGQNDLVNEMGERGEPSVEAGKKDSRRGTNSDRDEIYMYQQNFLNLANPGEVSLMLHHIGFDVLIVNIDNLSTEGMLNDLSEVIRSTRTIPRNSRPAVVVDDVIIHPIQIALAVENKADGVILNLSYVRNDLEDMLNYCVNLGTQAIVEVHDYNDIYYATQCGSYILMINEYDFLNNTYEYNHAIKAISYTIPELVTIAKINVSDINYVEKLGSLGYDSICLEKKLVDSDLETFVHSCKNWNAPHKTLLYLNRNNYLKEFLTYKNNVQQEDHRDITDNLKRIYDDKNIPNKYSDKLLKKYERDFIDVDEEGGGDAVIKGGASGSTSSCASDGANSGASSGVISGVSSGARRGIRGEGRTESRGNRSDDSPLTKDEQQIVRNFKKEKKKELMVLNQMKDIIKEVDDQCRNYDSLSDDENRRKEEKLETLLENFTKLDKKFLKGFFSDEEISNIENSIRNAVQQKKKIENGEVNIDDKNVMNQMSGIPNNQMDDFDIYKLTKEFFDKENSENHEPLGNHSSDSSSNISSDYSEDDSSSRGMDSQ
ncbi:conserved Plasmodium protein, unknown function [Plasmodium ovale]|uniref:indole-3-glycerol-phosphate synthase n=2 Tax=Plasmodium ovale TaxID=36330 RepID=A0A1A8WNZ9_PLAOA|nr:conserved Plasmodium protein, unknown function [Plasmodium ovale curtisi]SBS93585.1 conserved Plasmodium protein, unknown function [Plasmodium ovale curtisi]SCP04868.1 conserved Plasmodium protein, unknown function [Plasmodium ovale]